MNTTLLISVARERVANEKIALRIVRVLFSRGMKSSHKNVALKVGPEITILTEKNIYHLAM